MRKLGERVEVSQLGFTLSDNGLFEIENGVLYLKAGTVLDVESDADPHQIEPPEFQQSDQKGPLNSGHIGAEKPSKMEFRDADPQDRNGVVMDNS